MELSAWFADGRGVLSVREVDQGEASWWNTGRRAPLGWSRRGSGIDGANGMERAEVGQAQVWGLAHG